MSTIKSATSVHSGAGSHWPAGYCRPSIAWAIPVLALALVFTVLVPAPAFAGSNSPAGWDWPTGWQDPTFGASSRWRDWGFNTCGPANGDYGLNDSSWYAPGQAHLGVDSSGAGAGTTIKPVASGTIVFAGVPWGSGWGGVVAVEHKASNGDRFVVLYAHLDAGSYKTSGPVTTQTTIGKIKADQPYGDHLHIAVRPLATGEDARSISIKGATTCGYGQDGATFGYVHPIKYLQARQPATTATAINACDWRGFVVKYQGSNSAWLVRDDCKRYHIPTGGDYQSIVSNLGTGRVKVFATSTQLSSIPDSGKQARTVRRDDPIISGPTSWLHRLTGLGSAAYGGDLVWTTSAASKSYVTNVGKWDLTVASPGVYRVKCFVPNRTEAWAGVVYQVYDGNTLRKNASITQSQHVGWTSLGDITVKTTTIKIRLPDNLGSGPYNTRFAYDACEGVPVR